MPATLARPRSADAASRSTMRTVRPAFSIAAAIPAPIVPPPMTPTSAIALGATELSSGGRGAARSAKNRCRSAAA